MNHNDRDDDRYFVRRFLIGGFAAVVTLGAILAYVSLAIQFFGDPIIGRALVYGPFAVLAFLFGGVIFGLGLGAPPYHPPPPSRLPLPPYPIDRK